MGRSKTIAVVVAMASMFCARFGLAQLHQTYWSGSPDWVPLGITTSNYKALAEEATQTGPILIVHGAKADGSGLYQVISTNWGNSWTENFISSTDYKELATMPGVANQFYAARADGTGLDRVVFLGNTWTTIPVIANDYKALAGDPSQAGPVLMVYGARADGTGVDRVRSNDWGATWSVDQPLLTTTDYRVIESVPALANSFYGIRADGTGLERVYYLAGWLTQPVAPVAYKGLATDSTQQGPTFLVFGSLADGSGVDRIRSNDWGHTWSIEVPLLTTVDYGELATMTGVTNQFYASRADGSGLNRIYTEGGHGWLTITLTAASYKALAEEATQAGPILITHGARADGSGLYQIISTNWGTNWAEKLITTTDYNELATMHGIANQFYAARADGGGLERVYFSG